MSRAFHRAFLKVTFKQQIAKNKKHQLLMKAQNLSLLFDVLINSRPLMNFIFYCGQFRKKIPRKEYVS
jgi:hypothetical protein